MLHGVTKGLSGLHGVQLRSNRGFQRVTGGCKGLQGVTRGYKGLQRVTKNYRNLFSSSDVVKYFFLVYFS